MATKWDAAARVLQLALLSLDKGEFYGTRGEGSPYMCDAVSRMRDVGIISADEYESYNALWIHISEGTHFSLCDLLWVKNVLPDRIESRAVRTAIGAAFWSAVLEHILTQDKPQVRGMYSRGVAAVKLLDKHTGGKYA